MKFLQIICTLLLAVGILTANDEPMGNNKPANPPSRFPVYYQYFDYYNSLTSKNTDNIQDLEIGLLDSLANGLSYTGDNFPYCYEPVTNSLITIKRGFFDKKFYPTYTGPNDKNNLFLRISNDWGLNWDDAILVYSEKDKGYYSGRYPSCFGFVYDSKLAVAYHAKTVSELNSTWPMVLTGFWTKDLDYEVIPTDSSIRIGAKTYLHNYSDVKIIGKADKDNIMITGALHVYPMTNDGDNNNFCMKKADNLADVKYSIPPQWANSNFKAVNFTSNTSYTSEICNFYYGKDGKMYLGLHGNFVQVDAASPYQRSVGVSFSADNGKTWSALDVCPHSIFRSYAQQQGANPDSCWIPWGSKDFTILDNGDYSFVVRYIEGDGLKPWNQEFRHIVEVYKESGAWGIRKVGNYSGFNIIYRDSKDQNNNNSNPKDNELQLARTVDGTKLMAKWCDAINVRDTIIQGSTYYVWDNNDIFVSVRETNLSKWYSKNITKSNTTRKKRVTLIPDLLPNDLTGIPILSLYSKPNPNYTDQDKMLQVDSILTEQYVLVNYYDHTLNTGETAAPITAMEINEIYPNPADDNVQFNFTLPTNGQAKVTVVNTLGNPVSCAFSGYLSEGLHSVNIPVKDLASGTYYCVLTQNGKTISKMLNIIR